MNTSEKLKQRAEIKNIDMQRALKRTLRQAMYSTNTQSLSQTKPIEVIKEEQPKNDNEENKGMMFA